MPMDAQDPPPERGSTDSGALHSPRTEDDYGRLRADVARVVAQVCPAWLASHRDDLIQAVLMRVVTAKKQREGTAELSTFYLRKAAHSALVDEIRRWRRRQEVALPAAAEGGGAVAALPD